MTMKKIINDPKNILPEMMEGYLGLYGDTVRQVENYTSLVRRNLEPGKVGLLIGGGSGHEPFFLEYLGPGYADGVAQGNVFASPSPDNVLAVTKAINRGKGVIYVFGNHSGDVLNFGMAAELAAQEGIRTQTVLVTDDVALAPPDRIKDRRGIAGILFVTRIAGAACRAGYDLNEVKKVTEKANFCTRTMGVAVSPGTIPGEPKASFFLGEDEIEIGLGLHGEPGARRGKMQPADEIVDQMMEAILHDLPFKKNDDVCVLVNGLGSTSRLELMIVSRRILQNLTKAEIHVHDIKVGNYAICQEMGGVSISMMRLDSELRKLYDSPGSALVFERSGLNGRK
jgi:dihydroxyacetone kinase-like protein